MNESPVVTGVAKTKSKTVRPAFRQFLFENGLSLVLGAIFLILACSESLIGWHASTADRLEHHQPPMTYRDFLCSGRFIESTTENWESEFLEMAAFVYLTRWLYQRGSDQSKPLDGKEEIEPLTEKSPSWARAGGWRRAIFSRSLTLVLLGLFAVSFTLHAIGGAAAHNEQEIMHHGEPITLLQFLGTSEFWFQSIQNWQSEFLGILAMVVLSIFLRQEGSPESKPVNTPHWAEAP